MPVERFDQLISVANPSLKARISQTSKFIQRLRRLQSKSQRRTRKVFVELMPMLAGRTVLITVARENDKTVRVCVIPKKVKEDDNPALTTPLSYTGTPEELDTELGKHLASYVECHTQLG